MKAQVAAAQAKVAGLKPVTVLMVAADSQCTAVKNRCFLVPAYDGATPSPATPKRR
jgi:hypothetical protein